IGGTNNLILPGGSYGFWTQIKYIPDPPNPGTTYARQRYVTASGQDLWVFLLVDKNTGVIEYAYAAADHPAYDNGGDIAALPHPFIGNNFDDKEVVVLGKDEAEELKRSTTKRGSILTTLHKRFARVDLSREKKFSPLHTGLFSDKKPVMVEKLPAGIHVRALIDR
ncbi:MAG TPA: hypothetical protein PLB05_11145, partial [Candidatus Omnitrophota bacterium]|nr:hypothetical protein [Candidatus Omnitrophota bacterium]